MKLIKWLLTYQENVSSTSAFVDGIKKYISVQYFGSTILPFELKILNNFEWIYKYIEILIY